MYMYLQNTSLLQPICKLLFSQGSWTRHQSIYELWSEEIWHRPILHQT